MTLLNSLPLQAVLLGGLAVFTGQSAKAQDCYHHHHHGAAAQVVVPYYTAPVRVVPTYRYTPAPSCGYAPVVVPRTYTRPVYRSSHTRSTHSHSRQQTSCSRSTRSHQHRSHSHHH